MTSEIESLRLVETISGHQYRDMPDRQRLANEHLINMLLAKLFP